MVNKCPTSVKKCSKVSSGKAQKTIQPVPSTSGLNKRKGAPIDLISEDSCDGDSDIFNDDDELCCVCVRGGSQRSYSVAMRLLLQNGPNVTIVLTGHTSYTAQKSDL